MMPMSDKVWLDNQNIPRATWLVGQDREGHEFFCIFGIAHLDTVENPRKARPVRFRHLRDGETVPKKPKYPHFIGLA